MKLGKAFARALSYNGEFMSRYKSLMQQSSIIDIVLPKSNTFTSFHSYNLLAHKQCIPDDVALHKGFSVPMNDLLSRPGKMWRPALILMLAECLGINILDIQNNRPLYFTTALCELIHNASLVLDDIEDDSLKRRGEPCIHIKHGIDMAVNSGSLLYFKPLSMIKDNIFENQEEYYSICIEELLKMHIGQCMDIEWHNNKKMPSEENYLYMVANKTGVIPRLGLRLLKLISCCKASDPICNLMGNFGENIGTAFQIIDDYLNIQDCLLSKSKGMVGEDIKEGKRSLMVIHCFNSLKSKVDKARLVEILAMNTNNANIIMEAISLLRSTDSIDYSKCMALKILNTTWANTEKYLTNCKGKRNLKELLDFLIDRIS
jgi:geranylgeranyl pyrophosphate synthase